MKFGRKPIVLALMAGLAASVPQAHGGGFINNRQQWMSLSPETRIGYAAAINDSANHHLVNDTLIEGLAKKGRDDCIGGQKITAGKLAELITIAYRNERFADIDPTVVYLAKMNDVCGEYINRVRMSFGVPPIAVAQ